MTISSHAKKRMAERRINHADLIRALKEGKHRKSNKFKHQSLCRTNKLCIVYDPFDQVVITVWRWQGSH